jgi:hypothetical protein
MVRRRTWTTLPIPPDSVLTPSRFSSMPVVELAQRPRRALG